MGNLKTVEVRETRCPRNHYCPLIRICPVGAITQTDPFSAPVIDHEKCTGCGRCVRYCGYGAIMMKER
ncbi:MAG TPA: 4Fe-4S binding protein [Bacteroidales bacterium]|nr:4Fe-4S binding protein [Bacteroidales bacterium]HOK75659.1 4Fe-4S binding protein [Bacteroidales bacterium]HOM40246.1 4Fe-4S binding protein [Bacteroidales bacterium]HPP92743.1 4Fe-4S binding protein [Bacteroidales bacterium]HRR16941.1 4Fe-4S binding protein [Bacteroidales bacterium]